jgi:hypothetical protein
MKASFTKRLLALAAAVLSAAFAAGCPMYSDNNYGTIGCYYATDCPVGYLCSGGNCVPGPTIGGRKDAGPDAPAPGDASTDTRPTPDASGVAYCANPNDCKADETCSADGTCHSGDCSKNACINQYQCAVVATGGVACVHADSQACGADHQCAKTARCVDGRCTPLADLCTDRTQCPSGACVDGKCVANCTIDSQCPSGFLCRTALGICDAPGKACSITNDCGGPDTACVDGACVPRCGAVGSCADGGGTCVDNGCVPSQKPRSACAADGSTAGCTAGQICVHHACYTSCAAPNGAACAALAATPLCKTVAVGATTYSICGTTTTLGSDCDLTQDKPCTGGKTCVDGFCL